MNNEDERLEQEMDDSLIESDPSLGDFESEVWLSTDGKHTVRVMAKTHSGRKAGGLWAMQVYRMIQEKLPNKLSLATKTKESTETKHCEVHPELVMEKKFSQKTNKYYWVHFNDLGNACFGKGYQTQ